MKIYLINAPWKDAFCRTQRWPVVNRTEALRYPDWLAYDTAVLEEAGYDVFFVDYIANKQGHKGLYEDIERDKPDILVMELTTPSYFNDFEIAKRCKELGVKTVIFTGPHVTVFPEQSLRDSKGNLDIVAIGEHDYTVLDIVKSLEKKEPLQTVKGIAFLENNQFIRTENRPLIEDLDQLPFMAWHHLDVKQYHNHTYYYPYIDMIAGRGCPNKCTFCLWPQTMMGQRYRLRSAKNVYDEMVFHYKNLKVKEIFFEDDTLTANRKRLKELCELIIAGNVKMTWSCNCRCDLNDYELLCLMKKAGCRMLLVGPESGNQEILNNVNKNLTIEQIEDFCKKAKKAGLTLHSCWVFGLPGETKETIQQTIDFVMKLNTDTIQASSAMPQVGTVLYNWAVENNYLAADSWEQYAADGEQIPVLQYPHLSQTDLNDAVNTVLRRFYYRPSKVLQLFFNAISDWSLLSQYIRGGIKFTQYLFFKKRKVDNLIKK
ncbi:MAG: radical SAM protein [Bacteroidales bacterium]|jgi:anaerobic magnesium-protoporphyrin IX monomethyl ester cyclase|nr:radical SAM protein [Bacteroidales bacterium]MDD3691999.1 radical SAM protein [Bacteroidales bacterium]MDD4045372.1 radical SAM protein [Bacteroidales bacterium]MDD4582387.1 radical SAM protein [Bacteroidales bacterium]